MESHQLQHAALSSLGWRRSALYLVALVTVARVQDASSYFILEASEGRKGSPGPGGRALVVGCSAFFASRLVALHAGGVSSSFTSRLDIHATFAEGAVV